MKGALLAVVAALLLVAAGSDGAAPAPVEPAWYTLAWGHTLAWAKLGEPISRTSQPPCKQSWPSTTVTAPCAFLVASSTGYRAAQLANVGFNQSRSGQQLLDRVDFRTHLIIVVFSNLRPSSADQIEVRSVQQSRRTLKLGTIITTCPLGVWPSPGACTADNVHVFHAIAVKKSTLTAPLPNAASVVYWPRPLADR